MDSQDIPLREWLNTRFTALDDKVDELQRTTEKRLDYYDKVLLVGNGQPSVTARVGRVEGRLDTVDDLLTYDRQQIDALRLGTKKARFSLGGLSAVVAAIVAGIVSGMSQK